MKVYNEIYPSEGRVDKVHKFLKGVIEQDPKPSMYMKTKKRYANLACKLLDCVLFVLQLLEQNSMVSEGTDEFNELSNSPEYDEIQEKILKLNQTFRRTEEFSARTLSPPSKTAPVYGSEGATDKRSAHNFFDTCRYYDDVFKEASSMNFGYSEVNECAKLLYQWFHTRFMPKVPSSDFNCQLRYLPTWITNFILCYGKHLEYNGLESFRTMLSKWCDKVERGEGGVYAIPFEIYNIENSFKEGNYDPSDYTISAVVINDLLMNGCLFKLSSEEYDGMIHCNPQDLATIVKDRNPALYPKIRTRVGQRKVLIEEIGLTPVGGDGIDE